MKVSELFLYLSERYKTRTRLQFSTTQRLLAIGLWVLATAVAVILNRDWYAIEWGEVLYFLTLYTISAILSVRLRMGAYIGLANTSLVAATLVMGYQRALLLSPLMALILLPVVLALSLFVGGLRRYQSIILFESLWHSASLAISLLPSGWLYDQLGGVTYPTFINAAQFALVLLLITLIFAFDTALLMVWLALSGVGLGNFWRTHGWSYTASGLLLTCVFAPLIASRTILPEHLRGVGIIPYALGALLLYRITWVQIKLTDRLDDLHLLNSISQALNSTLDFERLLQIIQDQIGKLLDTSGFFLGLIDEARSSLYFPVRYEDGERLPPISRPFANGLAEHMIRTRKPLLITHNALAEVARLGLEPAGRPAKCFAGVPILAGERVIGVMGLRSYQQEYAYDLDDLRLLETIAASGAVALQNAQLYRQSQRQASELSSLNKVSALVSTNPRLDEVIETICQVVVDVTQCQKSAIFLLDPESNLYQLVGSIGLGEEYRSHLHQLDSTTSDHALVLRTKQAFVVHDISTEPALQALEKTRQALAADGVRSFIDVPMRIGETVIGSLTAYYDQPRHFDPAEIELLSTLSGQVAIAVENARLFNDTRTRARQIEVLYQTGRAVNASLSVQNVLHAVTTSLIGVLGVETCATLLAEEGGRELRTALWMVREYDRVIEHTVDGEAFAIADMPRTARAIREEDVIVLQRSALKQTEEKQRLLDHYGLRSGIGLPLAMHGELIGLIVLGNQRLPRSFDPETLRLAHALANQAAIAIQNARLFERTDVALARRLDEISALETISQRMTRRLDLHAVIEQVVNAAAGATNADLCEVALLDPQTDLLHVMVRHGMADQREEATTWAANLGLTGRSLQTGEAVRVDDVTQVPEYLCIRPDVRSEMAVPIILDGQRLGVINLESVQPSAFDADQERFVTSLAEHAAIAIQNARLFEAVQQRAVEFQTLRAIAVDLLSEADLQHRLQVIAREALKRAQARDIHIYLYDQASDTLTFGTSLWNTGEIDQEFAPPRPHGMTATAARSGERLVIRNPHEHPLFRDAPHEWGTIEAIVSVPLKQADEVIGVFNIAFDQQASLTDDTLHFLDLLATQAAVAIVNARLAEATRTSRDRLQAVLDSINDGILMFDVNGRLVLANPRTEYLLNIRTREFMGQHFIRILKRLGRMFTDEEAFSIRDAVELIRSAQENPAMMTRRKYTLSHPTVRVIEETSLAVIGANEEILGRLFILRDITQEYEMEVYRQEMSHMLVHDLRSPLAGVITGLTIAMEEMEEGAEGTPQTTLASTVRVALNSANDLLHLVEAILDVNKLEAGEVPLALEEVNLREIARQAYETLSRTAAEANIEVTIRAPEELPSIHADLGQIRRVMINLLDNALRYTPENGRIGIEIEATPAYHTVTIYDTGEGVPPELRERIFERFAQGDVTRRKRGPKGSGLGLTFCRLAVEAHGGRIWVTDGPEGGAAFHFTLPTGLMTGSMD